MKCRYFHKNWHLFGLDTGKFGICGVKMVSWCHLEIRSVFQLFKEVTFRRILAFCSSWEAPTGSIIFESGKRLSKAHSIEVQQCCSGPIPAWQAQTGFLQSWEGFELSGFFSSIFLRKESTSTSQRTPSGRILTNSSKSYDIHLPSGDHERE